MSSTFSSTNKGAPLKGRQTHAKNRQEQKDARDAVKKLQSKAYTDLPVGGLFISLFVRDQPHRVDDFHWGLYHHVQVSQGTKYHITGNPGRWIAAHGTARNTFQSGQLSVLVQIGQIPQSASNQLDQIMRSHDHELNDLSHLTCRVWVFTIVEKLAAAGMVSMTGTISALEDECKAFGNDLSYGERQKQQPRPVVTSTICS